ncbi:MAG: TIGR03905 family TSCPD domain-containing protein [Christensenellaceae bacterium]|nr:TIGR03905 family TSCPD domain-containing protein [Christensenellaceae bacterium]
MKYRYEPKGVCSREITFELEDGKIKDVSFAGGCNGNLQGIARLVEGLTPAEVIARLEGLRCGFKGTSCPDQLAIALKGALLKKEV